MDGSESISLALLSGTNGSDSNEEICKERFREYGLWEPRGNEFVKGAGAKYRAEISHFFATMLYSRRCHQAIHPHAVAVVIRCDVLLGQ